MSDKTAPQTTTEEPRKPAEPDKRLVERAPADSVEPALHQSGSPPRTFERPER